MGVFIDVKTFDNHILVILIIVIKKNAWKNLLIFRFAIF